MDEVIGLSPEQAEALALYLGDTKRQARVAIDEGRVKVSIDDGIWTYGVGEVLS